MAMTAITVTVDDAHLDKIEELAAQLRDSGMQVDQVLNEVGVICGSAPYECQNDLCAVPGVESVEGARAFQLPPPESSVQ
ncbi:MAG TPA: hypothetical protein VGB75_17055 [Jatrophihabitans sp.]|uniref:ketohydroxyglutarate aldolase n=1 Tax=Jatrophihabitans sp. TaxID=1932789 RepID=UPI002EE0CD12